MTQTLLPVLERLRWPQAGQTFRFPRLAGSADALLIAELASRRRPLVVVTASPLDAQRLAEEVRFFAPKLRARLFPDWETLPYDPFSPHQDLVSERIATLYALTQGTLDLVFVAAATALGRLPPPAFIAAHTFSLRQGAALELEGLRRQLALAGYEPVAQVLRPGEFAVRGGIVDLFPMGASLPYRIELFDEEIERIKTFDPDSQRTLYPVPEVELLPAREFPTDEEGRTTFRRRFRETFEGDPSRAMLYKDVSQGVWPAGIEYYLPLFFDETATLFDYVGAEASWLLHGDCPAAIESFWQELEARHRLLGGDRSRPILPPSSLFLDAEGFYTALKAVPRFELRGDGAESEESRTPPPAAIDARAPQPLAALEQAVHAAAAAGERVLLVVQTPGRRETLLERLREAGLEPALVEHWQAFLAGEAPLALTVGPLEHGFSLPAARLLVYTEGELFTGGAKTRSRRQTSKATTPEGWIKDLAELTPGAPVVHEEHGIGRYLGLVRMPLGVDEGEFLQLEYAGGDKLYVPVAQLHLVSRYLGADPEHVELHRLGSGQWEKAKRKAAEQARDTAAELLALYAQRAARPGIAFGFDERDYEAFCAGFPFETTPDQQAAIDAVLADMRSGKPMDRLVCGDVGFGKTEVALRAAFAAVASGKQVVILTPTTLLAEQHFQTFSDRFADWPVRIAELSRLRSSKEQKEALAGLAEGRIDIAIGTHRLLQPDVRFARLGLVIIDEEHRFGVRQKEALKKLRQEVDVLTLTATPIPRTLGMALEGLRDFSVIATAPQKRLAVKTFVAPRSEGLIREAVLREFKRGGQVYFVHNEVRTIENVREELERLLPMARIVVGHGQMSERELERVMRDFTHQRANLLLCTTIIETGIDIPTANTILIDRADRFGLAQLHQLRGRVGRSHHQAYAYLLTDPHVKPSAQAQKRLEAIAQLEDLGSGFYLAMHDLEIRGAGEVLGEEQSGEIQRVGFSLYSRMLEEAVRRLKSGQEPGDLTRPFRTVAEINLHTPALLPDDYCPDVSVRLELYKRLADVDSEAALQELTEELVDRFGPLPPQTRTLVATHRLRIALAPWGVAKVDASEKSLSVQFSPDAPVDPAKVVALIQHDRSVKMVGPDRLVQTRSTADVDSRVRAVRELVARVLAPRATETV